MFVSIYKPDVQPRNVQFHSNLKKVENIASVGCIHSGWRKEFIRDVFEMSDVSRCVVLNVGGEILIVIKLKQPCTKVVLG